MGERRGTYTKVDNDNWEGNVFGSRLGWSRGKQHGGKWGTITEQ